MATFYKYQERDLDSQVNYADIGLGISNLVTDQLATRKAKKEAYDDQVRAFNQYLDEQPKGDDVNMTEWTASYASQMQQQMLANQRAFKNGQISERDNVVFMQNVQNGTKTMFDLSADYQAEYADKMARMKSNDPANKSQYLESFLAQSVEGYGNFKNAKPIIDPKTGLVLMSIKQKDGTYQTVSAANLQTRIKAKYDYFDTDATATSVEAGIGEEITSTLIAANRSRGGQITAVQDKEIKDGFKDALTAQLNSYLVDQPLNVSSILTNTLKGKYDYTFSREEAEKDPTKILLTTVPGGNGTPIPDFSTENGKQQQKDALDYMYQQVIQKIDRKVEQQEIGKYQDAPQQQEWQYLASRGGREEKEYTKTMTNNLAKLYGGTEAEIKAVTPYLRDYDKTIKSVSRKNGVLVIERFDVNKDGVILKNKVSSKEYPFKTKNKNGEFEPIPFNDWLQGAALGLAGISDVNDAINSTSQNYKSFKNYADKDDAGKTISKEFRSDVIQKKQDGGTSSAGTGSTAAAGI
jgi:hypothetical protein